MPKVKIANEEKFDWKGLLKVIISVVAGLIGGTGIALTIQPTDEGIVIESNDIVLAEEQAVAIIGEKGSESLVEVPTVDEVDTNTILDDTTALGAYFATDEALSFYEAVGTGQCLNNAYGAQCFQLANEFWWNYAGRGLSSCGTGAAKGVFECDNAGDEFEIITDATEIQAGDWVVFSGGKYGHIGQALGRYNDGYVALFGQNQGGGYCSLGGSATNVINKSTKDFIGAFRPKDYIIPEPLPTVPDGGIVK